MDVVDSIPAKVSICRLPGYKILFPEVLLLFSNLCKRRTADFCAKKK